jgi:hypothetical protein
VSSGGLLDVIKVKPAAAATNVRTPDNVPDLFADPEPTLAEYETALRYLGGCARQYKAGFFKLAGRADEMFRQTALVGELAPFIGTGKLGAITISDPMRVIRDADAHRANVEKLEVQRRDAVELERRRVAEEAETRRKAEEEERVAREADPDRCSLQRLDLADCIDHGLTVEQFDDRQQYNNAVRAHVADRVRAALAWTGSRCRIVHEDGGFTIIGLNEWGDVCGRYFGSELNVEAEDLAWSVLDRVRDHEKKVHAKEAEELARKMRTNVSLTRLRSAHRPQGYLVERIMVDDGLTMLVGQKGSNKTFFSLMIAIAIAAGREVLAGYPSRRARVLLVLLEGTDADKIRRLDQLCRGAGIELEALEGVLDVYDAPVQINDQESLARLREYVRHHGYQAVFVDNLTELQPGNENDNERMAAGVRALRDIAYEFQIGVMLLHHAGKSNESRGATSVLQIPDDILYIAKHGDSKNAPVTVTRGKTKCGADELDLVYRLVGGGVDGTPIVVNMVAERPDDPDDEPAPGDLAEQPETCMLRLLAAEPAGSDAIAKAVAKACNIRKEAAIEVRRELEKDKKIRKGEDKLWRPA